MFGDLTDLLASLFDKQRELALTFAEWLAAKISQVTKPSTPVYIPKYPMTQEEQERVSPRNAEEGE